jgi:subfamily B ATP-binding cassette protein MsbA
MRNERLSLQLKGQTVALVIQSRAGKVPLLSIDSFYDARQRTITIDGTNIQDMNLQSLRGLMGLVTQDSILFNDTIKANISIGKLMLLDDEIIEALKIANA